MSEPEELIIDGAHRATRLARAAWQRYGPPSSREFVRLSDVRARLEHFVAALFGRSITIVAAEPPIAATWLARLARPDPPGPRDDRLLPGTDGQRLCLPPSLAITAGAEDALHLYRLLAVEQGARVARGTAGALGQLAHAEERDWFLVAEGALVDAWIASHVPGLIAPLTTQRADALARRPVLRRLTPRERALEECLRTLLASDQGLEEAALDPTASCEDTVAWTRSHAGLGGRSGRYRGLAPVWHWGRAFEAPLPLRASDRDAPGDLAQGRGRPPRVADMPRRPRAREGAEGEDDESAGSWVIRADDPQESVEDPFGLQRPADRDEDADPDGLADSLSELPEARVVRTPGQALEVLRSGEEVSREARAAAAIPTPAGIAYPEWDCRVGRYRHPGAVVREPAAPLGDPAWVTSALSRHGRLVRRVRSRFDRLRPRHVRVGRQPDGSELDIDACVTTAADLRANRTVDGRLYVDMRPVRRELTVALLVDVSASTDSWVSGDRRVIDVEKEALVVVCEALDALGDPYGIFAFSGEGPEHVAVLPLKPFRERNGHAVRRRIAALDADRYTRIGAPVRHVTAALCRQPTRRRLLLILSDGRPNDVDVYEGRYGVEDARQAVAEARRQGVNVFCLTVDREAPRYALRMFGPGGFAVLHRADQLPVVLIDVLRQLVRS